MRTLMIWILLAATPLGVHARTWTVEKDGSGDFTIIQDAIDAAADGDTVRVGPGRYDTFRAVTGVISGIEGRTIARVDKAIALVGAGRDVTTIGPQEKVFEIDGLEASCLYLGGGGPALVTGFTFENTRGYVGVNQPVVLEDCRIDGANKTRADRYSVHIAGTSGVEIRNVEFLGAGGILTANFGVGTVLVENCTFWNDVPRYESRKSISWSATDLTVRNCTFEGTGVAIGNNFGGSAVIEDCVLSETIAGIVVDAGSVVARNLTIGPSEQNVRLNTGSARLEIYDSELQGGSLWTIDVGGSIFARNCTILNRSALTVRGPGHTGVTVDLRENFWGTTDVEQVRAWIDNDLGVIQFEPILLGPVSAEPQSFGGLKSRFRSND